MFPMKVTDSIIIIVFPVRENVIYWQAYHQPVARSGN